MKNQWFGRVMSVLVLVLVCSTVLLVGSRQPVAGRTEGGAGGSGGPHYSVVETQGHNLLVSDNATNKLYFYTVDKDKPIGSPLKLRASLDLSKVGEPEININAINVDK
jgi:hypothetical protein